LLRDGQYQDGSNSLALATVETTTQSTPLEGEDVDNHKTFSELTQEILLRSGCCS
jgi:hypothetical protein